MGSVVQFPLPGGGFAYGRVLRDASVAFYCTRSNEPGMPPIGEREYEFVVGVYDDVLRAEDVPVVGHDPGVGPEDEWPPPYVIRDALTGRPTIYHHGTRSKANEDQVVGLEPAAVWARWHLIERLVSGSAP
ncbi:hypothetical protein FHX49_000485 [Microbacterium endophyticum]|uniref:Uncharacterized protein n=1 Tax=Microbacterium endophyticum TaxID=1526412 RepID=A0A7W4V1S3_9MICO|nr:hypothetical protein [Microbacterium endophyticum]